MSKKTPSKNDSERPFRLSLRARLRLLKKSLFGKNSVSEKPEKQTAKTRNARRKASASVKTGKAEPRAANSRRVRQVSENPAGKELRTKKQKTAPSKKTAHLDAPPPMPPLTPPPQEEGKTRFCDLALAPEIQAGAQDLGFKYCTVIQEKCLPFAIAGKDLAAKAQTGTGKTAAFLASAMTHLIQNPLPPESRKGGACRVLVLSPTRELAIQIHNDALALGKYTALNNIVIFGGMDHQGQRD